MARTLHHLGKVLREQRDLPGARQAYGECLKIRRDLAKTAPRVYRPEVASTQNNLGNVLREQRDLRGAREAFEHALSIYRNLAEKEPHIFRCEVAATQNNLGDVLRQQRDFRGGREAFEDALNTYGDLEKKEPGIHGPNLATTMNDLAILLDDDGDHRSALDVSRQAIKVVENIDVSDDQRWLVKGRAGSTYKRWLEDRVSEKDPDGIFRCLAALREGLVQASGSAAAESMDQATAALGEVSNRIGRALHLLVAQRTTNNRSVFAVISPHDTGRFRCELSTTFPPVAEKLHSYIVSVFDKRDARNTQERQEDLGKLADSIRKQGAEGWRELPDWVRAVLTPNADHDVLISGDQYWSAFPWEALRFGDDECDWLGLHRTLARWGPLTAASIRRLGRRVFGDGAPAAGIGGPSAAIVCPWNASPNPKNHLPFAKEEAEKLTSVLLKAGYSLRPHGVALLGQDAQPAAMKEVLSSPLSVIHYTGHGAVIGNEEVLVLHGGDDEHLSAYFGRQEIAILKNRLRRGRLLSHRPLVVLNSCRSGRTRDFGGQREDLAWTLLAEGADAVIASALPVYDSMGQLFGESLYSPVFASPKGMGQTLVEVRRLLEKATRRSRMWPTWTLLTYHGNPYTTLPHSAEVEIVPEGAR